MSTEISSKTAINRHHPAALPLKERRLLTGAGSTKKTFHIVLDSSQAPLPFKVGDSLGIYPQNDPLLVCSLLQALKASGEEEVIDSRSKQTYSLKDFLSQRANLSRLTSAFLKLFYTYATSKTKKCSLETLLCEENKEQRLSYLQSHDLLDLLKEYKESEIPLQEICNQFGLLLPRFYSIASSPTVFPNEIHLTVTLFTFTHQNEVRYGVASHFLCSLAEPQATCIPSYIHSTPNFTLPEDPNTPLILIGPGTGIAPFRAFIQERIATNSKGDLWLFFGERHRATDYLYQEELEAWEKEGNLRLSLAFSRESKEKVYVQHELLKNAKDVWQWLQRGAHLYICGDAQCMAKSVDVALHSLVSSQGNLDEGQTKAFIKDLKAQKRYLLDVY